MAANPYCLIGGLPMNNKPIAQSRDADLRNSYAALLRTAAAARPQKLTLRTGMRLVVGHGGSVWYVVLEQGGVAEFQASCKKDA